MYQELLTVAELARLLKVSQSSIYHRVGTKGFPAIRIGSAIRFNPAELGLVQEATQSKQPSPPARIAEPPKVEKMTLLERIMPEIEKAFAVPPAFGDISIRIIMHEGVPVRIETSSSVSKLISQKPEPEHTTQNRLPRR